MKASCRVKPSHGINPAGDPLIPQVATQHRGVPFLAYRKQPGDVVMVFFPLSFWLAQFFLLSW